MRQRSTAAASFLRCENLLNDRTNEYEMREQAKQRARNRRQRHRRNGLCLECSRKSTPGKHLCVFHLFKARVKAKQEYEWRIANGICVKCGTPKEEQRRGTNCISCANKAAAKERGRREAYRNSEWRRLAKTRIHRSTVELFCSAQVSREDQQKTA